MDKYKNTIQNNIFCIKRTFVFLLCLVLFIQSFYFVSSSKDLTAVTVGENGTYVISLEEMVNDWNSNLQEEKDATYVGPNQNIDLRLSEAEFDYNVVVKEENLKTYMVDKFGVNHREGFQKGKATINGGRDCYFFLDGEGAVYTGFLEDLNKDIYYFAPEQGGEMFVGNMPGVFAGVSFNEYGALVTGRDILIQNNIPIYRVASGRWINDGNKWYYMFTDIQDRDLGLIRDQVIRLYNPYTGTMETYVFDETGLMLTGNVYYRGKVYALQDYGENIGALIPELMKSKYTPEEYEAMFSTGEVQR